MPTTRPDSVDRSTTDAGPPDPGTIDPGTIDPGTIDPGTIDPGTIDPGTIDPGTIDPGTIDPGTVDFHFDAMCPFAYQASVWIRDIRAQLGLTVNWRFFSLEEINRREGKKHPWEREWSYGWSMMRIGALLRRTDMDALDRWYEGAGRALHIEGRKPHDRSVAREILAELGLDPSVVDEAIADRSTHDEVKADHDRVVASGGYGVPTLFFGDDAIFGPVMIDPPTGAAAVRLWRAVTAWLEFPNLFEIQRMKTPAHAAAITEAFGPYLAARDWISIDRGRVIEFGDPASQSN